MDKTPPDYEIRRLTERDAEAWRALRLQALKDHPEAFATAYEEWADLVIRRGLVHRRRPGRAGTDGAWKRAPSVRRRGSGRKSLARETPVRPAVAGQVMKPMLMQRRARHGAGM